MSCVRCHDNLIKNDEIIFSLCKTSAHYYCQGMNDLSFSKLTRNTKSKWACIDCKSELHTKKRNQNNSEGNDNVRQLTESV